MTKGEGESPKNTEEPRKPDNRDPRSKPFKIILSDETKARETASDVHWHKKHGSNKQQGHRTSNTPRASDNYSGSRERHKR